MILTEKQSTKIRKMIEPTYKFADDKDSFKQDIIDFLKKSRGKNEAHELAKELFTILQEQRPNINNTHRELLKIAETMADKTLKLKINQYCSRDTKEPTVEKAIECLFNGLPKHKEAHKILNALEASRDEKIAKIAKALNFILFNNYDGIKLEISFKELFDTLSTAYDTLDDPKTQRKIICLFNNYYHDHTDWLEFYSDYSKKAVNIRSVLRPIMTQYIIEHGKASEVVNSKTLLSDWLKTPTNIALGFRFYNQRKSSGNTSSYRRLLAAANVIPEDKKPVYKHK